MANHLDRYPTPANLSYIWGFGSLAGRALVIQIVTGVCLARHYAPEVHLAFASVEHIRRDVRGGAGLRYVHANGASRFFIIVYTHRFRGLYYGSYVQPRVQLWRSGIVVFVLRRAVGFRGYVLPWGQRSFWGATVITNLFSAIPGVGPSIVQLLWGGFSVDNPTLNRFFSLHYLVPFLIAGAVLLHLALLHIPGSNNPLGLVATVDRIPFYPYFYVKDLFGFTLFILFFSFFVVYAPNLLGHPDNYIEANPLVTPAHIVPEWYYLPFYAILRTVPDKLGGVLLRGGAIAILALLPIVDTSARRSHQFKPLHLFLFWAFVANAFCLGWIGQEIVETPFVERATFVALVYFAYFVPLLPLLGRLERALLQRALALALIFCPLSSSSFGGLCVSLLQHMNVSIVPSSAFSASAWGLFSPTLLPLIALGTIPLVLLALAVFLPARGELSRFLTRLAGISLLFHLIRGRSGLAFRLDGAESDLLSLRQSDALYPRLFHRGGTFLLAVARLGLADRTLRSTRVEREFPLLLLLLHFGAVASLRLTPLRDLLLSLERVTLAAYVLTAVERRNRFSTYAGVQYFLLGSVPSASLLLSFALFYRHSGALTLPDLDLLIGRGASVADRSDVRATLLLTSTRFEESTNTGLATADNWWENSLKGSQNEEGNIISLLPTLLAATHPLTAGTVRARLLLFVNLLFKLTAAPFQFWAPGVYGKTPLPSVTVLATSSKVRVLALLLKLLPTLLAPFPALTGPLLLAAGIGSVTAGRVGALAEPLLKRFFVFSSMGHVGFRLVGVAIGTAAGSSAAVHYAAIYALSALLGWFLLLARGRHRTHLLHLTRLARTEPVLAFRRALLAFSRAGLPPLGGFFVKLDVLSSLVDSGNMALTYVLFVLTVISFFYYLRLVKVIFFDQSAGENGPDYHPRVNVDRPRDEVRLALRIVLSLRLSLYLVFVHPPVIAIVGERLGTLR